MKNFLIVLVLLAVVVAGLGFYQGWFHLSMDKVKMQEDKEKVESLVHQPKTPAGNGADKVHDQAHTP